jgi:type II secretion system protein C
MDLIPTITSIVRTIKPFESLDIRLHGIVYKNNNAGYAMISLHSAMQEIYTVNSEIMDQLVVTEIAKNHVEVAYFGEQYRITIDGSTLSSDLEGELDSGMTFAEEVALVEEDHRRNPIRLLMIRRPYAVYEDGRFLGYLVMPGSNHDQFKRLGFQSGDIITYLNGTAFEGPGKEGFVIAQLTHSSNIDLTVMRGEDQLNIIYGF